MTSNTNTPLGKTSEFPLDAQQTIRKTYDKRINAHRSLEVAEPWNKVSYTYNSSGQILTETYLWEETAEVTEVSAIADCSADLDGKSIALFTKEGIRFQGFYIVDCTAVLPSDSDMIKHIPINLNACDAAIVIALATKLAYENHYLAACHYTITRVDNLLTFAHVLKGETINAVDIGTCFTFNTKVDGVTNTVEVITYCYN